MSSNKNQAQKGKGKGKEQAPPAPKPDTTEADLQQLMRNSKVTLVVVEALGNGLSAPADPKKREMGKKKNHWALRLPIGHPFTYRKGGVDRTCSSVRVSIEHPPGSLTCQKLTLKAMENDEREISRSAYVSFLFRVPQPDRTVRQFLAEADALLPFTYTIVARTLSDQPGTAPPGRGRDAGNSGRNQELSEHPNGCRDFTAQWFYRLHLAGLVAWETHGAEHAAKSIQPIQETEAFHHLIGYRYSPNRVDKAPIAKAKFGSNFTRVQSCTVELIMNPDAGQPLKGAPGKYTVVLPYQDQPPAVQTFKRS